MKLYSIRDWNEHFENNRSRTIESLSWVAIPNRHDGEHYTAIVTHADGARILAGWLLIVEVASKCRPRGRLVRDDGSPLDSYAMALKTRAPKAWFDAAFQFLETATDWLVIEDVANERQGSVTQASVEGHVPAPRASNPVLSNPVPSPPAGKREFEGETNGDRFDEFWERYPKKVGKEDARRAYRKARVNAVLPEILAALDVQTKCDQWTRNGGQFIPNPSTYLNQGRWKDDTSTYPSTMGKETERKLTPLEIQAVIRTKESLCADLKHKHSVEGALTTEWNDLKKRDEFFKLRKEIKELQQKLSSYA